MLSKVKVNQSLRYVHSCLELIFLIPTCTNNPSQMSVVLESSAKPKSEMHARHFKHGLAEDSRTINSGTLVVVNKSVCVQHFSCQREISTCPEV